MWGVAGAFLAVPLLVIIRSAARRSKNFGCGASTLTGGVPNCRPCVLCLELALGGAGGERVRQLPPRISPLAPLPLAFLAKRYCCARSNRSEAVGSFDGVRSHAAQPSF